MTRISITLPNAPMGSAVSYYRSELPYKFCKRYCSDRGIELSLDPIIDLSDHADIYYFHRTLRHDFLIVLEMLVVAGKELWFGFDDDMWSLPIWNPAHHFFGTQEKEIAKRCCELASRVIVSTETLKKSIVTNTGIDAVKVFVCPNLVDLSAWVVPCQREEDPVRIVWAGSIHHDKDISLVVEPLKEIMAEFGEKVRVLFFGDLPEDFAHYVRLKNTNLGVRVIKAHPCMGQIEPVPLTKYPLTLSILAADIGLAPLCQDKFNDSKSAIKWMEYSLSGAATIASARLPFSSVVTSGIDGELVSDGMWYAAIKSLILDKRWRTTLAMESLNTVKKDHSWKYSGGVWHDLFSLKA